jgi:hypothetical protein
MATVRAGAVAIGWPKASEVDKSRYKDTERTELDVIDGARASMPM